MTDAIERAARAICEAVVRGDYADVGEEEIPEAVAMEFDIERDGYVRAAATALASLRPGDRITLADGTECWIAPMEASPKMLAAALPAPGLYFQHGDMTLAAAACMSLSGGKNIDHEGEAVKVAATMISDYRAMRDACKEDEG